MTTDYDVVVIGASLVGHTVVETLRDEGYAGDICLVGDEPYHPYDRPPLSKNLLTDHDFESARLHFRDREWYAAQSIEMRLGTGAAALTPDRRIVLGDGLEIRGEHVVIATGSRSRTLPSVGRGRGIFAVRNLDDAHALRSRLESMTGHATIIGAGFIGLEVAAAAARLGWTVTVAEKVAAPLSRVLPPALASICWSAYDRPGVALRSSTGVRGVWETGAGMRMDFDDGTSQPTDAVVVAVGGEPNTEWLAGSGVELDRGVVCDGLGQTSVPGIYAAGDVARWPNRSTGSSERCEQWQASRSQAVLVASRIAGTQPPTWAELPYFWSDLLGGRVQLLGHATPTSSVLCQRASSDGRVACVLGDEDRVSAVFTLGFPRAVGRGRILLGQHASAAQARVWLTELTPRWRDAAASLVGR